MHILIILASLSLAYGLRWGWSQRSRRQELPSAWSQRWQRAWFCLVLPPLVLIMTAIAILLMGPQGQMVWGWEGWTTNLFAIGFLSFALICMGQSIRDAQQTLHQARQYPLVSIKGQQGRHVNTDIPLAACIGFWHSELLVSQGLLELLTPEQIDAVLVHEQAHQQYRDTFWFFWWGWLRSMTRWLPYTETLWEELLTLRELRADQWASQKTDGLLLAESLLLMVQAPASSALCVPFGEANSQSRLAERIEALLAPPESTQISCATILIPKPWIWSCVLLSLLPLLTVPFHY